MTRKGMVHAAVLLGSILAFAAVRAADPNPEGAANMKAMAESIGKLIENLQGNYATRTGDLKVAADQHLEALKARVAAVSKYAEAFKSGDDVALKDSQAEYQRTEKLVALAQDRLNVRQNQVVLAPEESQIGFFKQQTPEVNRSTLEALLVAKKKTFEAGNALVAVLAPESAPADIETARDAYIQAKDEHELLWRKLRHDNERIKFGERPGAADSADVTAKLAELGKTDTALQEATKATKSQALQLRILERKRAALIAEINAALSKPQ